MSDTGGSPDPVNKGALIHAWLRLASVCLIGIWVVEPASPAGVLRWSLPAATVGLGIYWLSRRSSGTGLFGWWPRWADGLAAAVIGLVVLTEVAGLLLYEATGAPLLAPADSMAEENLRRWRGRPGGMMNGARLNSLGFVGPEFQVEKRPGVKRIAVLGDSCTVGVVPYEHGFVTGLAARLGDGYEIHNFGVIAVGPREYLHLYRTEVVRYDPDLVLLCFFVGNDFERRRRRSRLHRDSLLGAAILSRLFGSVTGTQQLPRLAPDTPTLSEETYMRIERGRLEFFRVDHSSKVDRKYRHTAALLGELQRTIGDRLRVVIAPDELQVNDALYRNLVGDNPAAFDREKPNRVLSRLLSGVPRLDLLETLRNAGPIHKPRDTHWNVKGNAVVAEAVAGWLLASGSAPGAEQRAADTAAEQ